MIAWNNLCKCTLLVLFVELKIFLWILLKIKFYFSYHEFSKRENKRVKNTYFVYYSITKSNVPKLAQRKFCHVFCRILSLIQNADVKILLQFNIVFSHLVSLHSTIKTSLGIVEISKNLTLSLNFKILLANFAPQKERL